MSIGLYINQLRAWFWAGFAPSGYQSPSTSTFYPDDNYVILYSNPNKLIKAIFYMGTELAIIEGPNIAETVTVTNLRSGIKSNGVRQSVYYYLQQFIDNMERIILYVDDDCWDNIDAFSINDFWEQQYGSYDINNKIINFDFDLLFNEWNLSWSGSQQIFDIAGSMIMLHELTHAADLAEGLYKPGGDDQSNPLEEHAFQVTKQFLEEQYDLITPDMADYLYIKKGIYLIYLTTLNYIYTYIGTETPYSWNRENPYTVY